MSFIIPAPEQAALRVSGSSQLFPIRRVFCVGRNYADHVVEMGGDPDKEDPFFFSKPADAVCQNGLVPFPPKTEDLHHEMELVVAMGADGKNIAVKDALDHVVGYAAGVDLTRRDLQAWAKKRGRPWSMAKGFDHSAPCSDLALVSEIGHPDRGRITLSVNGETKQDGDLGQQVWEVQEIISNLSSFVELVAGDLIMTGTPAGVGPLQASDRVEGSIEGVGNLSFTMGNKP